MPELPVPPPPPQPPLDGLRAALDDVRCLMAEVEELGGRLLVTGTAAGAAAVTATREVAGHAAPGWEVGFELTNAGSHLCDALAVVHDALIAGRRAGPEGPSLKPGAETLRAGEPLTVELGAPAGQPVHMQLDYFTTDGLVVHLLPNPSDSNDLIEAGAVRRLGERGSGGRTWSIGPPFGHEMLVALAAPAPLFATPRAEVESASAYLADLREVLQKLDGTVQGTVRFIVTAP